MEKLYIEKVIEEINEIVNRDDRLDYILDLGDKIKPMNPNDKTEASKVKGCASNTYIQCHLIDNKIYFSGDSESLFAKAYLFIMFETFSGLSPLEVLGLDNKVSELLSQGVSELKLIPSRANSIYTIYRNIIDNIKKIEHS